jgi:hypothetical protein
VVFKDVTHSVFVTSKDIIEEFIKSQKSEGCVDVSKTGRSTISVYNALLAYLKRHPRIDIRVCMSRGEIVLVKKDENRSIATIH